ncbi:MAG: helicase-exonuclease AddAB subunit AddA [Lachnospiraceae bacterium]|nr:helicase-exonuclease AddAB subunit AddA [Lachnospiraceae bacterium]
MAVNWTKEQEQVIYLRNRAILVSAAAGSGKTAVLVERIIQMITDRENPVDIDRLLIVTFTNAAAAEMRERITSAIERALEDAPEDAHLQRQQTLVHTAQIMTIDSFCLSVIRDHFDLLDFDPSFRIGDEGERKLLKSDVVAGLLEDYYSEADPEFFHFVESYSTGKNDSGLEDLILRLYEFAMSYPDPEEWLKGCLNEYPMEEQAEEEVLDQEEQKTMEQAYRKALEQTKSVQFLMEYLKKLITDCCRQLDLAKQICSQERGPYQYLPAIESDFYYLEKLVQCKSYQSFGKALKEVNFIRLSSKKDSSIDAEKKARVKEIRDRIKEEIRGIGKQFYFQPIDKMLENMANVSKTMAVMVRLTLDFHTRYQAKKRERNLMDFSDVEHLALNILTEQTKEGRVPSLIAKEYRDQFTEIMIDEYQDSNLVQEAILFSVSRYQEEIPNVFMVGDVKQSIYKFRLARPELFVEKYQTYTTEESNYQKIDLHKNFRSRPEVLQSVNDIFYQIMRKELGGVTYDNAAALYPGAAFPEGGSEAQERKTELLLINKSQEEDTTDLVTAEMTALVMEAKVIAGQIRRLTHPDTGLKVLDKKSGTYRTAQYRDIVVLLRTVAGWGETIVTICMEEGIPAHTQSQTGYFTALEVQTVLNLLRIIDNPRQDIPLAGVLHSPIGHFSSLELAKIRSAHLEGDLYEALLSPVEEEELDKKVKAFLEQLEYFRDQAACTPIHELIRLVLKVTGYGDYAASMPAGTKRRMNLDMLLEKAIAFEATSYRGVFHFIRYIEKLNQYEVDFGEASIVNEQDNTVRIMSIHKSKGLEFPIVIVAGMGKKINQMDAMQKAVIHPDLGVGLDFVNYERRTKAPVLIKRIIQKSIRLENLGEELRILYVALTRAKEKLILTGVTDKMTERYEKWRRETNGGAALSYASLAKAESYLDWIVPAITKESCEVTFYTPKGVAEGEILRQKENMDLSDYQKKLDFSQCFDPQLREEIEKRFSYLYPYQKEMSLYAKTSVSEQKRLNQREMEAEEDTALLIEQKEEILPKFMQGKLEGVGGATRGTAYHIFLENMNLAEFDGMEENEISKRIGQLKRQLVEEKKLSKENAKLIWNQRIVAFLTSQTAKRMREAEKRGQIYRETQFVVGIPAWKLYRETESQELILLQGVIDVYFEEEGKLVLLDYKTDAVYEGQEEVLVMRYERQFELYKMALEQMTGEEVGEMILYSFGLGKEIRI